MRRPGAALAAALLLALPARAAAQRLPYPLPELESRARRDSCDAVALYNLAIGYFTRQRYDDADTLLRRAVNIDPQFGEAFFALGLIQSKNNRYWERLRRTGDSAVVHEDARRRSWTRRAFLVDPFVDVRLLGALTRGRDYGSAFGAAMSAFLEGDYHGAFRYSSMVVDFLNSGGASRHGLPPFLLWVHALAASRSGNYRPAIADLEELLRVEVARENNDSTHQVPLNTNDYRYLLAANHQRLRENTLAIRMYEQVLTADIGNYMAHVQLARIYESERGWLDAVRERQRAVDANPEDHTLHADLGATLAAAGRMPEAEEPLQRAAAMQPLYPRAHYLLGLVEQKLGHTDSAVASLRRYLAIASSTDTTSTADARRLLALLGAQP